MDFLQEKGNRQYLTFLLGLLIASLGGFLFFSYLELSTLREMLISHESTMVSVLLEEGVPKETIALACSKDLITERGRAFLLQIGRSKETSLWLMPEVQSYMCTVSFPLLLCVSGLGALLLWGTLRQMRQRERLYQDAQEFVEHFVEGDFSGQLLWNHPGTLYRLFSSIDQLAKALQTRCEAERQAKEFLKDTISDISHQLKTPLAALWMYTEIITKESDNPDTVQLFIEKSMQSLIRMEELVQSLLKMMRLDAKAITFEKQLCSVVTLVKRAEEPLKIRAAAEKKQFLLEGKAEECVFCDPIWTSEAIGNLLKNALEHTDAGENIHIFWESSLTMFRIFIKDNGCGIAAEDFYHIFKRFYRSLSSTERTGVGLGLPLAKAIVEGQGGILSVESEVGHGSVFCISLPL